MRQLKIVPGKLIPKICQKVVEIYKDLYFVDKNAYEIHPIIGEEVENFLPKMYRAGKLLQGKPITGELLFDLYQTYGLPFEVAQELLSQWGRPIGEKEREEFEEEERKHQEISRKGMKRKFAGGLAEKSKKAIELHTATHLLHQALRDVLGEHVQQVGSNITSRRLRFDFSHNKKLSTDEIKKVEKIVNQKVKADLPVKMEIMTLEEAKKIGALALFEEKYGEKIKVYFIGNYSVEACAGPHVSSTGEIGNVKIVKEESAGAGKRRIYAVIE